MRIDLGRPMAKGNFIVFKGPTNKGKSSVAYSTIKHFLEESDEHRAIYVSSSPNSGEQLLTELPDKVQSRALALGVHNTASTDADVILGPYTALHAGQSLSNVLIVFDDIL